MRVSDKVLYNTVTSNLQQNLEKMLELQESGSSGKRINRPSDDPIGAMKVIDYMTAISKADQYQRNIDNGISSLDATESAIATTQDILVRAKELSISALNGTSSASDRGIVAKEVQQLYEQVLQIANTQSNGGYIFAGYNIGTPAYNSSGTYTGTAYPGGSITVELTGYRGETEDVDIVKIITDLAMQQNILDVSRASAAKVLGQSLLDFLS